MFSTQVACIILTALAILPVRVDGRLGARGRIEDSPKAAGEAVDSDEYGDYRETRYGRSADVGIEGRSVVANDVGSKEAASQESDEDKAPGGNPPVHCTSYGFYPDISNSTLFWYCDVPENGEGFQLRHMLCGQDRYFDALVRNCVLKATIRQDRQGSSLPINSKAPVNCLKKKPGKYRDEANCFVYHLCLPPQFLPAVQLTFKCPKGAAYDPVTRSCTTTALRRCEDKRVAPGKNTIDCRSPIRFRSLEDCGGYFMCFVDNVIQIKCPKFYKFDDTSLECLPEKVAQCQEHTESFTPIIK